MEKLKLLEEKIKILSKRIPEVKSENQKLKAELKFFESEADGQKKLKYENGVFQSQKIQIKDKLTKLLNKFEQAGLL